MASTGAKQSIIDRHAANELLHSRALLPMQRSNSDLSTDQPNPEPASEIVEAAAQALEEGQTHYVDVPGIQPLRAAIAAYLNGIGIDGFETENVLVSAGVQESRFLTIQTIGELYGGIALPSVVDPGARKAAGIRPLDVSEIPVDEDLGMLPTIATIRDAVQTGSKLIYLESPSRLTGAAYGPAEVEEIADILRRYDAAVIWDQGMSPWVDSSQYPSLGAQSGVKHRVALIGEAFPGAGLQSWYIGYVGVNTDWLERMRTLKQIIAICTSTPSQFAATKAAEVYQRDHSSWHSTLSNLNSSARREIDGRGLDPLPGAAVNVFAFRPQNAASIDSDLKNAGFTVADGEQFGASGVLRMSVDANNLHAEALRAALQSSS